MSQKADGHYTMAADTGFIGLPEILEHITFHTETNGIPVVVVHGQEQEGAEQAPEKNGDIQQV